MLHAPDTAMFTAARLLSWYTVALSGSLPKGAQVYDAGSCAGKKACMFTVCVSQQHWWSDLLLAVMLAKGGERAASRRSLNLQVFKHTSCCSHWSSQVAGSYLIQVSISA